MKKNLLLSLSLLLFPLCLFAHPHTFMDMRITVLTDSTYVTGFDIEWRFDFINSYDFYYENDYDLDGKFDPQELEDLQTYAFRNLENYHYFTNIYLNGKLYKPTEYTHFRAFWNQQTELLTYKFVLPFKCAISEIKDLAIGIWDDTYFCDIAYFKSNPFKISGNNADCLDCKMVLDTQITVEYDNTDIGSQREDAVYDGYFSPTLLHIKPKH